MCTFKFLEIAQQVPYFSVLVFKSNFMAWLNWGHGIKCVCQYFSSHIFHSKYLMDIKKKNS